MSPNSSPPSSDVGGVAIYSDVTGSIKDSGTDRSSTIEGTGEARQLYTVLHPGPR